MSFDTPSELGRAKAASSYRRILYRVRQFAAHVATCLGFGDRRALLEAAGEILSGQALCLFCRLGVGDQAHALCVLQALRREAAATGETLSPHLAQAALLHDVGKASARMMVWHRVLVVLLGVLCPPCLAWLAQPGKASRPHSWRHPFYVACRHAELGALLCEAAGLPDEVVWLVRHHEGDIPEEEDDAVPASLAHHLAALRRADDGC